MPKYKQKIVVGKRQLYRRVANEREKILEHENNSTNTNNLINNEIDNLNRYQRFNENEVNFDDSNCGSINSRYSATSEVNTFYISNDSEENSNKKDIVEITPKSVNDINSDVDKSEVSLSSQLRSWALKHVSVPHNAISDLLHILFKHHDDLPLDSRTLLRTPVQFSCKELDNGSYSHFGLESGLKIRLNKLDFPLNDPIGLSINIDGLPLFNSCSKQFWPILCVIDLSNKKLQPFSVGIFYGNGKPHPLEIYLEDFINELLHILKYGICINSTKIEFYIHSFICDAPARAFIKCVKYHSGYSSCDKCTVHGEYLNGRVVLRELDNPKRTDASFQLQEDESYHMGFSPLLKLNCGLVSKFPIDYMHCVLLGVMKKLLCSWAIGPSSKVKLSRADTQILSDRIESLSGFIPKEINRKPRSLLELPRYKATEFRTFLLYVGPTVLHSVVELAVYEHFLLFHVAISILCSSRHLSKSLISQANLFLKTFIEHGEKLYGKQFIIFNVHLLSHLCDDVHAYGPLDKFSTFPFENYLGQLKRLLKSSRKPLAQIYRRVSEIEYALLTTTSNQNIVSHCLLHKSGPVLSMHPNSLNNLEKFSIIISF